MKSSIRRRLKEVEKLLRSKSKDGKSPPKNLTLLRDKLKDLLRAELEGTTLRLESDICQRCGEHASFDYDEDDGIVSNCCTAPPVRMY